MSDNVHDYNNEETEQDEILADVTLLKTQMTTANTDITTLENKMTGVASSGLKTLIESNDADIASIKTKTDLISIDAGNAADISQMEADIATNNAKNSYPSADATKMGFISISQNVNLDSIESSVVNNSTNISSVMNENIQQGSDINGIKNNTLSSNLKTAVDANSAKVSTQWSNNGSEVYINENVGIKNSNPNCDLEIGNSTGVVRLRLNGSNNLFTSSELLFTDNLSNTAEYFQGAGIRFNSFDNKLQFITDNGNDGTAEIQMSINRSDGFIGIKDTSPSFELDVNGEINGMKQYHYYQSGIPMIIGITSLNSSTVSYHRLGYGQGSGNGGGSITENTFFMPDTNFKVVFRPFSSKIFIRIHYLMDRYFSGRSIYWALGTTSSSSSIIGRTVTFSRGGNSEWTSRQEVITLHDQGYTPYTSYVRYIFCKSIVVNSDNTIGSTGGNTGWILWGGHGTHSDGGGQTIGHYESDSSPNLPTNSDNFGPLEAVVYGIPNGFSTASTSNPLQYIGY